MIAPITGVPCFYARSIAWQWQRSGKNSQWVKVADESLHVPFFLDDNTGRLLVDPQSAEMDIHRDCHEEFGTSLLSFGPQIPPNISTFLARHCISRDQKLKVEEYCIKPKNSLFILGTLAQNPGLSATAVPVRTVISDQRTASFNVRGFSGALSFGVGEATPIAGGLFSSVKNTAPPASSENSCCCKPHRDKRCPTANNYCRISESRHQQSDRLDGRRGESVGRCHAHTFHQRKWRGPSHSARVIRFASSGGVDERCARSCVFHFLAQPARPS